MPSGVYSCEIKNCQLMDNFLFGNPFEFISLALLFSLLDLSIDILHFFDIMIKEILLLKALEISDSVIYYFLTHDSNGCH